MRVFTVDSDKCNFCGLCGIECTAGIIVTKGPEELPRMSRRTAELCINCGHCIAVCPTAAITLDTMNPEDCTPIRQELLPTPEEAEHFLKSRRSGRVFKEEPVPRETLAKLIDIARYAPSGHNLQPVQWLVVANPEEVRRLSAVVVNWMRSAIEEGSPLAQTLPLNVVVAAWGSGFDPIMRSAPHAIVAHASGDTASAQTDGIIALTYLELAAHSLGIGACWAGFLHFAATSYPPMLKALQLPEGHQCLGAMMIGYPKHRFARIPLRNEPAILWR
jgi:nitroreductase/NAD-dependent dihydropyrimidine dehydrogenase PreA subunit